MYTSEFNVHDVHSRILVRHKTRWTNNVLITLNGYRIIHNTNISEINMFSFSCTNIKKKYVREK